MSLLEQGLMLLWLCADGELATSVEDAECPDVVRSEESAAVGLRNLVTQWHIAQKGALSEDPPSTNYFALRLLAALRQMF